jgi:hypothetical protein
MTKKKFMGLVQLLLLTTLFSCNALQNAVSPKTKFEIEQNTFSLESAGDGSGVILDHIALIAGQSKTIYAILRDSRGAFVSSTKVTWSVLTNLGSFAESSTSAGVFSAVTAGSSFISAVHPSLGSKVLSLTVVAGVAKKLLFVTEPPSSNLAGVAFTNQPIVAICDSYNNIVSSGSSAVAIVSLTLSSGSGTLDGTFTSQAAVAGIASFASQGLNIKTAGNNKALTASVSGSTLTVAVTSTFTINHNIANKLSFSTAPSSITTYNTPFAIQPVIEVQDAYGNRVINETTVRTITMSKSASSTGTLSGTLTQAASSGLASFSGHGLQLSAPGVQALTASAAGLTSADSASLTILAGAATQLSFQVQPPSGTVAQASMSGGPIVQILDASGNLVTTDSTTAVTLSLSAGTGTLTRNGTSNLTQTAVNGLCDFSSSNMKIDLAGTNKQLTATATNNGSLTATTSGIFSIVPGAATQLVFTTAPASSIAAGTSFALVVEVQDVNGNRVTSDTSTVTVALAPTPGNLLNTTLSTTAVAGIATFSVGANNLHINVISSGNTITASSGSLTSAVSSAFSVTVGAAHHLSYTTAPVDGTVAGTSFPIVVEVRDSVENVVTTNTSTVTLALAPTPANLLGTSLSATAVAGVATFSTGANNLHINVASTGNTLTASNGAQTDAVSSAFAIVHGTAHHLTYTTAPVDGTVAGTSFAIVVEIRDLNGNVATDNTSTVTLALAPTPANLLNTSLSSAAVAGIATFSIGAKNLHINVASTGNTLTASNGVQTDAVSSAFAIVPDVANHLAFFVVPDSTTTAGSPFATQPQVEILDSHGNRVTDTGTAVTLNVVSGTGTFSGTNPSSSTTGLVIFPDISYSNTETFTMNASSSGLTDSATISVDALFTNLQMAQASSGPFPLESSSSKKIVGNQFHLENWWNSYAFFDPSTQTYKSCGTSPLPLLPSPTQCFHVGEKLAVSFQDLPDCQGLELNDRYRVFDWACDTQKGHARFTSTGLRPGKGLSQLIRHHAWRPNSVTLTRDQKTLQETPLEIWWKNPIIPIIPAKLPSEALASVPSRRVQLKIPNSIYSVDTPLEISGIEFQANNLGLVVHPRAEVSFVANESETRLKGNFQEGPSLISYHHKNFHWIEGKFNCHHEIFSEEEKGEFHTQRKLNLKDCQTSVD